MCVEGEGVVCDKVNEYGIENLRIKMPNVLNREGYASCSLLTLALVFASSLNNHPIPKLEPIGEDFRHWHHDNDLMILKLMLP